MSWQAVAEKVGKIAPMLGTALGGPAGGAIGVLISQALGVPNNPDDVLNRIETDPSIQVKLLEIQSNHEIELQKIVLQQFQAEVADRDSARDFNSKINDKTARNLAYLIVISFFVVLGGVFYLALIPGETSDKDVLIVLVTELKNQFDKVTNLYFGATTTGFIGKALYNKYKAWKDLG